MFLNLAECRSENSDYFEFFLNLAIFGQLLQISSALRLIVNLCLVHVLFLNLFQNLNTFCLI